MLVTVWYFGIYWSAVVFAFLYIHLQDEMGWVGKALAELDEMSNFADVIIIKGLLKSLL